MEEVDNEKISDPGTETSDSVSKADTGEIRTDIEVPTFDFEEESWRTDFVLNVEGIKLHVARNILSFASPVFDRMFQSEFKESSSKELALPGKKVEDVKEFLRCIYPNTLVQITFENALTLLPLFEEYQVLHLKRRCENVLIERVGNETPTKELYQRLRESDMYNLKNLRQKCIILASNKPQNELDEAKRECKPPAEDLVEILEMTTAKLRVNIAELTVAYDELSRDADKLQSDAKLGKRANKFKEANKILSEEIDVWRSYAAAEIRKSQELVFDKNLKWKEMHVVLTSPVANGYRSSIQKEIWDIPINISSSAVTKTQYEGSGRSRYRYTEDWLRVEIESKGVENVSCYINIRCDLVNRQPSGENTYACFKEYFYGHKDIDLKNINEIAGMSKGFTRDGRIALIVHMYMSEPNR